MDENETANVSYDYDYEDELLIPSAPVQFWTYLIFEIPSIICAIYLLYYLIFHRRFRKHLHNHVIIVLLFLCLVILVIDNSFYLDGWRTGQGNSFPNSSSACLLWWFIDYGFYGAINVFLVWAAFERHILVFHRRQLLTTKRRIFFVHYLPLILLAVYLLGFYTGAILIPPCQNTFYYKSLACGSYPCYQEVPWLNTWDYFLNGILSNILEAVFSIGLLVRTIWKKLTSQGRFNWKKYRKMTVQLLSISTVSLSINLPQSLIILVRTMSPNLTDFGSIVEPYFFYFTGYIIILIPVLCLGCLPELWPKFIQTRTRRLIGPMTVTAVAGPTIFVRGKTTANVGIWQNFLFYFNFASVFNDLILVNQIIYHKCIPMTRQTFFFSFKSTFPRVFLLIIN